MVQAWVARKDVLLAKAPSWDEILLSLPFTVALCHHPREKYYYYTSSSLEGIISRWTQPRRSTDLRSCVNRKGRLGPYCYCVSATFTVIHSVNWYLKLISRQMQLSFLGFFYKWAIALFVPMVIPVCESPSQ